MAQIAIRSFAGGDASQVRELFITVNRLLSPPDLRDSCERYIERALADEIDRISAYYGERRGGFWVAVAGDEVVGTFGLEPASDEAMELRRMYVKPSARRRGIARQMLQFAEHECRRRNVVRLELSTAEIQTAALALYRTAGYALVREETAEVLSNKTASLLLREEPSLSVIHYQGRCPTSDPRSCLRPGSRRQGQAPAASLREP